VFPDLRTIVLVLVVTNCIAAIALFLFYRLIKEINGLQYAALGGGSQALGSVFLLLRDSIDPMLSIMVSNTFFFLSFLFYYQAVRLLTDLKTSWVIPSTLIVILSPLFMLFPGNENLGERIIVSSLGLGILGMMCGWVLGKNAIDLPGRKGLSLMFFLFSAISLWRIPNMLITPIGEVGFLDFNAGYMIFLWGIINSIVTTIGLIILASEKLQQQLRAKVEQVSYARDIANRSLQEQQHFMTMLSHEFKAPIGAIKANADAALLLATPHTSIVEESLSRIKNVSERLNSLVERCLDDEWMAHSIENNQVSLEPVSLTQILRNVSDEFNVPFQSTVNTDAMVKGEPIFLPVLFANLIANGLRHTAHIESVQVNLLQQDNDYLVRVMDDGDGIDEQQRHYIFDKYYRADNGHSAGGSGLGLFFVKKITEMHDGEVTVNCDDGVTTFTVRLAKSEVNNG
tara:strand:- start:6591 stop:7958 length:1368 start_codon:yes stop_codon:yes gene_type:complete